MNWADSYENNDIYYTPLVKYIRPSTNSGGINLWRRNFIDLQLIEYNSDNGFFVEDRLSYSEVYVSGSTQISDNRKVKFSLANWKEGDVLFQNTISFVTQFVVVINRSYKKLQNVLAEVGGLIGIVHTFCSILLTMYHQFSFYTNVLSKYDINYEDDTRPIMMNNQNIELKSEVRTEIVTTNNNINRTRKPNTIKFNNRSLVAKILCCQCKSKELSLFNKAKKKIDSSLEIHSFIGARNELNLLKFCLFSDSQHIEDFEKSAKYFIINNSSVVKKAELNNSTLQAINQTSVNNYTTQGDALEKKLENKLNQFKRHYDMM
jgi:hypothetical protein